MEKSRSRGERLGFQTASTIAQYLKDNEHIFSDREAVREDLGAMGELMLSAFSDYLIGEVGLELGRLKMVDVWRPFHREERQKRGDTEGGPRVHVLAHHVDASPIPTMQRGAYMAGRDEVTESWIVLGQVLVMDRTDAEPGIGTEFVLPARVENVHFWQRDPCFVLADLLVNFLLAAFYEATKSKDVLPAFMRRFPASARSIIERDRRVTTLVAEFTAPKRLQRHYGLQAAIEHEIGERRDLFQDFDMAHQLDALQRAFLERQYGDSPYLLAVLYMVFATIDRWLQSEGGRNWEFLAFHVFQRAPRLSRSLPLIMTELSFAFGPFLDGTPDDMAIRLPTSPGFLDDPMAVTEWTLLNTIEELRTIWQRSVLPRRVTLVLEDYAERLTMDVNGVLSGLLARQKMGVA